MFMVIKEDIENLIFKCEKLIDVNIIKDKRNKKEIRTLKKVLENYEVNEGNEIIYTEINNRYNDLFYSKNVLKEENKHLKTVIRKLKSLINSDDVIEEDEIIPEIEDSEIGQLE